MTPKEHLHLKHVLQTVCALEAVVHPSFGPEGGQVLFTRDTAQAMLSRSGTRILTALRLEHPLARMVVECVWKHSTVTGDGSKTFIILLASLLRMIHSAACKETNVSRTYNLREAAVAATARRLADELLAFASEKLDDLITKGVVPYGYCVSWEDFTANSQSQANPSYCFVKKLLSSFFHTRLGYTHCDFMSNLTCELLTNWKPKNDQFSSSLQFLNDNFPALHTPVSGFPVNLSRLVEGQVIHRDFATPFHQTDCLPIKAVVFPEYLQPQLLNTEHVLKLGCGEQVMEHNSTTERSLVQFSAWAERSLGCIIANLQSLGVSVLLSAVKQSAAVLALATQAEMCVVECVSEDELSLFLWLSGVTPVSDCWMIEPEHIVNLTFCRPITLGAHRYIHVGFSDLQERSMVKSCSLVICGPGEGQTDQYACAIQDAIRMLLTALKPPCLPTTTASNIMVQANQSLPSSQQCVLGSGYFVPVGGTFEFLLNHVLLQQKTYSSLSGNTTRGVPATAQLFANALLSVPQKIYSYNLQHFLHTQTRVLRFIQNNSHPFPELVCNHQQSKSSIMGCASSDPLDDRKIKVDCSGKFDAASKDVRRDSGFESVSCKYQLLLAVLQCVTSLLRVDSVLYSHRREGIHFVDS
ncbi:Bardet-Biedl syndrome 10 protein isoform X2 [Betta splendens]|nr:Bardet-Biedl syndrome 10 protein isoform X2 [Betta splendens]XP_055365348.1 Bardet-Biedl syndrome 10 protein isoform X2 [Betta splendens]